MTWVTRCSACATSFRVVQDQLKASGGWVRCGRCNEIFNAIDGLHETPAPPAIGLSPVNPASPPNSIAAPAALAPRSSESPNALIPPIAPVAPVAAAPTSPSATPPQWASAAEKAAEDGAMGDAVRTAPEHRPAPESVAGTELKNRPSAAALRGPVDAPVDAPADELVGGPLAGAPPSLVMPAVLSTATPAVASAIAPAAPAEIDTPRARHAEAAPASLSTRSVNLNTAASPLWGPQATASRSGAPAAIDPAQTEMRLSSIVRTAQLAQHHPGAAAPNTADADKAFMADSMLADEMLETGEPLQALPAPDDDLTPSFVRDADRAQRWRTPAMRATLGLGSTALAAVLMVQAGLTWRDHLAVRWPVLRPALELACAWASCRLEPPRQIGALSVESSGLQQLGSTGIYNVSVALRNRASTELMTPSMELALTDVQGRVVARKVMSAADFGRPTPTMAAGSELALQAALQTGDRRIAGYTIEIFYP